jgi:methionyl-tRNA formyltransferase
VDEDGRRGEPGEVLEAAERLVVACGAGALALLDVQREGKRRMTATDFLNGYPLTPGIRLGSSGQ